LLLISMLKNLPKRWHLRLRKCCLNRVPLDHWTRTAVEFLGNIVRQFTFWNLHTLSNSLLRMPVFLKLKFGELIWWKEKINLM
jgi:hypothetical protein